MDIGLIHGIWTITLFVCFGGVVWWAYNKRQKPRFEEAANLIFADEPQAKAKQQEGDVSQ
uniref:cbb3-type cytochrome oxidase subunit 3 n=1 Tax=Thaumasiovibrio occultus TaxID=1891184 RepID=UPI000B361C36|nr:CcoQ/FixQ family Cbb3-type cytochrome c oxidase assembly chaperone [Thaumasiovibrio occultus]